MKLQEMFVQPVDRHIEGVIKADDQDSLKLEIEEYVLTNEVAKRLEVFLDAYTNYYGANGVWVSGFFGSGKSHLLKMLALLIENREIEGTTALELFLPKCTDNSILQADLKRAADIPSQSILFNIDQKADVISKTQIDALLSVFVKVFDEMCGYYGKQGHIAQFERELDQLGLYEKFKNAYAVLAERPWENGREQALLESKNIAKAYAEATGNSEDDAMGILKRYRSQYRVSIEDFAQQVKQYIDQQSPDFRLNFFVDEVGQYVANNVKLMTNLQTIAESLATKCKGRAWIIVTAQEDMNTLVGDMGRQQGHDFSKIQARFLQRMKLTSTDVAEVIQRRLLMKNEDGMWLLSKVYHQQENNFKTLFDFADGAATYRNFRDRDHFIQCYPFIPYQFDLFQLAIQNLSHHNAFEGKHSSVGERSMLAVFQQVAVHIADHRVGQLATFDLMFEGIRTALKSDIQQAVLQAEKQLDNRFAVRLLKALFLVKYVKSYKATMRNLCVLMLEGFDADLAQLRTQVEEALNLLEQQTYIQRTGDTYEYLTDEEKDVEQEIKNTDVETAEVSSQLDKLIFDSIIKDTKIRYEENRQDYPYTRKLDGQLRGRESELAIHVITPFHEHAGNDDQMLMHSMVQDELLVLIPPDDRIMRDVLMYKRAEKYIRQNISMTQQESIKRIIHDKSLQNQERNSEIQMRLKELLRQARLFVGGEELDIGSEDPQRRIVQGFQNLIARTYPNLLMLRGIQYSEQHIAQYLEKGQDELFEEDDLGISEAEQEIVSFIQGNKRNGTRTTIKHVLERFSKKPYGWYYAAVLCQLAKLCSRGKLAVRYDANLLEDDELEAALKNSRGHSNVMLDLQTEITPSQIRTLKTFYSDFFDKPAPSSDAKVLGKETAQAFEDVYRALELLAEKSSDYPFLRSLTPVLDILKDTRNKPFTWFYTDLLTHKDELLGYKESTIDPIRRFMSGVQREIFDDAASFIKEQEANFSYLDDDRHNQVKQILLNPECYKNNHMQQAKRLATDLRSKLSARIKEEQDKAQDRIDQLQDKLLNPPDALPNEVKEEVVRVFDQLHSRIKAQQLISMIRDLPNTFESREYRRLLEKLTPIEITAEPGMPEQPRDVYTQIRQLNIPYPKAVVVSESDVEAYLHSLRKALLEAVRSGKKVQV